MTVERVSEGANAESTSTESRWRRRPDSSEYDSYYETYVSKVGNGDVIEVLRTTGSRAAEILASVPAERLDFRYADGKWSVREVIGHMIDAERVFSYRALCFARGDETPLPGMDQDVFMARADFGGRSHESLVDEFRCLRAANVALFSSFSEEVLDRGGVASDSPVTVRALIHIIAGHVIHHLHVLQERYLE